jgi:hypothetical protein
MEGHSRTARIFIFCLNGHAMFGCACVLHVPKHHGADARDSSPCIRTVKRGRRQVFRGGVNDATGDQF